MTITYERVGTSATGGAGANPLNITHSVTVNAGDLAILIKETRNDNDVADTTPSGFTLIGADFGGVGAWGIRTGNARCTAWFRECDGSEDSATIAVTWNVGSAGGCTGGQVLYFSKTAATWETPILVSGDDVSSDTSWSVTGGSLAHAAGDMIVAAAAINTDGTAGSAQALTATGVTYGAVTQRVNLELPNTNYGHLHIDTASVTVGATAAPTHSETLSAAGAGTGLIIRLREGTAVINLMGQCCT